MSQFGQLHRICTFGAVRTFRSFRYELRLTARQQRTLERLFLLWCELYTAALEDRHGARRWEPPPHEQEA